MKLITNPDQFFNQERYDGSLKGPAAIVLALGLLGALMSALYAYSMFSEITDTEISAMSSVSIVIGIVVGFFTPLLIWFVYAAVFHVISRVVGGDGDFRTTFRLTGWGFLPQLPSLLLLAIATSIASQSVEASSSIDELDAYVAEVERTTVYIAADAAGILFLLWCGLLWLFAIKHAQKLSFRRAIIVVAIPLSLSIIWNAYTVGLRLG